LQKEEMTGVEEFDCTLAGTPFSCHKQLAGEINHERAEFMFSISSILMLGNILQNTFISIGLLFGFLLGLGLNIYFACVSATFSILFFIPMLFMATFLPLGPGRQWEITAFVAWSASICLHWPLWTQGILVPILTMFLWRHAWMAYAWPWARKQLIRDADLFQMMWGNYHVMIESKNAKRVYSFDRLKMQQEHDMKQRLNELAHNIGLTGFMEVVLQEVSIKDKALLLKPPTEQAQYIAELYGYHDFEELLDVTKRLHTLRSSSMCCQETG